MRKRHNGTKKRHIYLLVCWQERDERTEHVSWRFTVETANGDSRLVFRTLMHAFEYVQKELNMDGP